MRRLVVLGAAVVLIGGGASAVMMGGSRSPESPPAGGAAAPAEPGSGMAFDYDGDGFADLTVGAAEAVQVSYGSASGVTDRVERWDQDVPGVLGDVSMGDGFGHDVASGDLNGDGYADLAIGVPGEGGEDRAGAVQVLFGSPGGLTAAGNQIWDRGSAGVLASDERIDGFGRQLAVGDFDGDGYADLVIRFEQGRGTRAFTGRVVVLHGSPGGLSDQRAQVWDERSPGIASEPRSGEFFGGNLASGDVNGDGLDDLAIGVGEDDTPVTRPDPPAVHVLLGSPEGLTAEGSQYISLTDLGIGGSHDVLESVWFDDVNGDGRDDLTLSVHPDHSGGPDVIAVLHGHDDGVHPALLGEPAQPGADGVWYGYTTMWGTTAVSGDLTGDGYADLAMLEIGLDHVSVVLGTPQGLGPGVVTWPIDLHPFSPALNVLPLSGGSHQWLVIGAPSFDLDPEYPGRHLSDEGAVVVLRGTQDGDVGPVTVRTGRFGWTVGGTNGPW